MFAARSGFSLIELMVAVVMLSVGVLPLFGLVATSTRLKRLADSRTEVTHLATEKLEELRAYGATKASDPLRARLAVGGSTTTIVAAYADSVMSPSGVQYRRQWQISNGLAATRQVSILVTRKHPVRYTTPSIRFSTAIALR